MKIYIDADGCPVVDITIKEAAARGIKAYIICDSAHIFNKEGAETISVGVGSDSADFKLVSLIQKGDLAITQDYGLAALCLAKGAYALNQNGFLYTEEEIDALLMSRHMAKQARKRGERLKAIPPRTLQDNQKYLAVLTELLDKQGL